MSEPRTYYFGVAINHEKGWYEWKPSELTENIFLLIGSLGKQTGLKVFGDVEEHPSKEGYYVWRFKKS